MRIAINGMGRIGRCVIRILKDVEDIDLVAINDPGDHNQLVHLLKYDSTHGVVDGVKHEDGVLKFGRQVVKMLSQRDPKELPASIIKRLPIRLTFDENYFFDKYQGIPVEGYTSMVQNMLEGIEVRTGIDYFKDRASLDSLANRIVFTGKIDEYYGFRFGELEYRTLRFEHEEIDGDFQGNAVVNYTHPEVPFTRILEHKHFQPQTAAKIPNTIVTREYSDEYKRGKTPYYPINNDKNTKMYKKYEVLARREEGVIFGGRLAEYKYYDMHQVIGSALHKSRKELEKRADGS